MRRSNFAICATQAPFIYFLEQKELFLYSIAEESQGRSFCFANYTDCIQRKISAPQQCPYGFLEVSEVSTCGNTTEPFSYRHTLPCTSWHTCAQKVYSRTSGCINQFMRYIARKCVESE